MYYNLITIDFTYINTKNIQFSFVSLDKNHFFLLIENFVRQYIRSKDMYYNMPRCHGLFKGGLNINCINFEISKVDFEN